MVRKHSARFTKLSVRIAVSVALAFVGGMVGDAAAVEVATPTPPPNELCETVTIPRGTDLIRAGEGNVDYCIEVDAPGECCWTTVVDGYAMLTSPAVQCGDQSACFHVYNCDCSGCRFPFGVVIAGQRIPGECTNYTPSIPTPTTPPMSPTPTPTGEPCDTIDLPNGNGPIIVGEGNRQVCVAVDAPGDCCWRTAVSGLAIPISPDRQCGDQSACVFVGNCDCATCSIPFEIVIAGQTIQGECRDSTPTPTPPPAPVASPTPSPTKATSIAVCGGDCNADGIVHVDELVTLVDIALGNRSLDACLMFDSPVLTVVEVVTAVSNALYGCPLPPSQVPPAPTL